MDLKQRVQALTKLGQTIYNQVVQDQLQEKESDLSFAVQKAYAENGWFTPNNIYFSLKNWAETLTEENLHQWISAYNFDKVKSQNQKTVAIIMAGNIPMVGFHDFLSVLISGNKVLAKLSSNDKVLLPFVAKQLIEIEPGFKEYIQFTESKLQNFDAVIATGSNNTSRYFDYYFGKYSHIIRRNRNSVAVLSGMESEKDLQLLADDIFRYFGLGCRNVSKIYVPSEYDFTDFFQGMFSWKDIIHNNKYINNYDYNKAVYLMDNLPLLDNEFMLLKEDKGFSSPIAVVYYEKYESVNEVRKMVQENAEKIQCSVSKEDIPKAVPFGSTQTPNLWDYADGIDTIQFLLDLK